MNIYRLFLITEKLQKQSVGDPVWMPEKETFEYARQSIEVVAILKIIRAAQGIKSLKMLCENGLFIDMGAIYRCVNDCTAEVYFLLEEYPKCSNHVDQFVKGFFETTKDGYLNVKTEHVETKKIHSAMVRALTGLIQDEVTRERILRIHKVFSGYVHANYVHILQIYGDYPPTFNLAGVPSTQQQEMHMKLVVEAYYSVLYSIGFVGQKLGLADIYREVIEQIQL
jgi:hypothetical protein